MNKETNKKRYERKKKIESRKLRDAYRTMKSNGKFKPKFTFGRD